MIKLYSLWARAMSLLSSFMLQAAKDTSAISMNIHRTRLVLLDFRDLVEIHIMSTTIEPPVNSRFEFNTGEASHRIQRFLFVDAIFFVADQSLFVEFLQFFERLYRLVFNRLTSTGQCSDEGEISH